MATFTYRAIDIKGRSKRGVVTASTARQARDQLRLDGLSVRVLNERKSSPRESRQLFAGRKRYQDQLTGAMRELSTLLQVGVPLLDAISSLLVQTRGGFHECLVALHERVSDGSTLADAMLAEPQIFDEMTVGMTRVGEHAGNLDEVCDQIASFRERGGEMRDRVVSALLYPLIVFAVSVGVTVFLMTVVVPMLLTNLVEMGRPLPWPTRVLKSLSDLLLDQGIWILLVFALLIVALIIGVATDRGKRIWANFLLQTPVAGSLIQKQLLSRMSLVIASLLRSGVELVDALRITERSMPNVLLRDAITTLREDLEKGRGMRESIERHKIFTHSLGQVFYLGQQSGQLDAMLERIGNNYDRQAGVLAGRLTSVVEPVLILLLAIIVGFVLFATVLPILEAGNVLTE